MRILNNNYVKTATITPYTETPQYEFDTAFKDVRLTRVGRTLDDTSQYIDFDLGSAKAVNYICVLAHNLTSSATVTIMANSTQSWSTPPVSENLTVADKIIYNFTATKTYRYWRLNISDSTNPDTYIEISKVYIGDYIQLPYMAKNQKIPTASTSDVSESNGGQVFGNAGYFYQYGTINFSVIEDSEKLTLDTLFRTVDKYIPVILLIWENDLDIQDGIYARITSDFDFTRVEGMIDRRWSLGFSFKEVF